MPAPVRRDPVSRFFVGLWDAMNFTRRLIFNLVFFGFLALLAVVMVVAMARGNGLKPLQARTTLVLAPEGALVEQFSADPFSRALAKATGQEAGEVQLRDLLRAIEAAKSDQNIERVLLDVDKLQPSGYASLRELAAALAGLKASGKQVVAFGENLSQAQYLLAAQANEVYLDPMGSVVLEGLGRYRQYFRQGLQDKLGVDVHLFRVGQYKSAAEPYILDAASADAKEADLFWMNDVWNRYLADLGQARKLDPQALAADIDALPAGVAAVGGDLGQYALQHKLVDGLKTRAEVDQLLVQRGAADKDDDHGLRSVGLDGYLARLDAHKLPLDERPQVAVVVAAGEIGGGKQQPGKIGGESTSELLRQARTDDKVKAVVLRVDSPGGEVFASEQIRREVVALKAAGKPVVVSMGDLAASGGYWIGMNADRIFADPSTISGSIGIFGLVPNFARALDKIGVHTDGVGTTKFAGAFDLTRPLDPQVGQMIQAVIDKGYADFTGKVAAARGKTVEQIDAIARGRVWSGQQALERGLVDQLGGLKDAVADAAARAKLGSKPEDYRVRYVEKALSPFEQFLAGLSSGPAGRVLFKDGGWAQAALLRAMPQAQEHFQFVQDAVQRARTPGQPPVAELAYCFCGW
ncbi:MAG: signal peptide peptidase SppA [Pseudoxanthomonas sp.]